jgi:DNA modification methylase
MNTNDYTLIHGDCYEKLKELADNSVDSVITDPPYGLGEVKDMAGLLQDWIATGWHDEKRVGSKGFLSKEWDNSVPPPAIWKEVYRVLKPGGTALVFAGTRTFDLMALSMKLAGFVHKDTVMFIHGAGFPKALNISKALDKDNGKTANLYQFVAWFHEVSKDKTNKEIDEFLGLNSGGGTAAHFRCIKGKQPRFPCVAHYYKLQKWLGFGDKWDSVIEEAEREIVGKSKTGASEFMGNKLKNKGDGRGNEVLKYNITIPKTEGAKQWDGWYSHALKPAFEPILVMIKSNEGSYADNALKWGVAGLNIDSCRIPYTKDNPPIPQLAQGKTQINTQNGMYGGNSFNESKTVSTIGGSLEGRWPANLIHDGSDEVIDQFPETKSGSGIKHPPTSNIYGGNSLLASKTKGENEYYAGDSGSAARFFYCSKASPADRSCDGLVENKHPTVKNRNLMAYLARLTKTPSGGVVLDPFMGSGSTLIGCIMEGRPAIGIEKDKESFDTAQARVDAVLQQPMYNKNECTQKLYTEKVEQDCIPKGNNFNELDMFE